MLPPPPKSTLVPYTTLFRSGDWNDHAGAMGGIVHGRKTMPPRGKTTLIKHQRHQSLVVILRLGIENGPELPLLSPRGTDGDRKSTRLNSSHTVISYAVFCLK